MLGLLVGAILGGGGAVIYNIANPERFELHGGGPAGIMPIVHFVGGVIVGGLLGAVIGGVAGSISKRK